MNLNPFVAVLRAANAICSIVPPLVWAVALLLSLLGNWYLDSRLESVKKQRDTIQGTYNQLVAAVEAQKKAATALLKSLTDKVLEQQKTLNERHRAQEIRDGNNDATIARQAARLRALSRDAGGLGLRDPNAAGCRCGGGGAEGAAPPAAGQGAGGGAQAPGLLSVQLERLLLRLTREADDVNGAYESCRADALNVRGLAPESHPPDGSTAAPAAP